MSSCYRLLGEFQQGITFMFYASPLLVIHSGRVVRSMRMSPALDGISYYHMNGFKRFEVAGQAEPPVG